MSLLPAQLSCQTCKEQTQTTWHQFLWCLYLSSIILVGSGFETGAVPQLVQCFCFPTNSSYLSFHTREAIPMEIICSACPAGRNMFMPFMFTSTRASGSLTGAGGRALAGLGPGDLEEVFGPAGVDVIVSTIPAAAEFTLPDFFFASKPAVLDAAYKPPKTALLAQAMDAGCPYAQGAEMLIEQGIEQFQFWTERLAPAEVLREAVYNKVEKI